MTKKGQTSEEPQELSWFLLELGEQCSQCMIAFNEFETIVKNPPPLDAEGRRFWNRRVWLRVHVMLSASSTVSRILWPNPDEKRGPESVKRSVKRGRDLRAYLGIKGDHPLIVTKVRNAFEHIDEQLDDWLQAVPELIPLGWAISSLEHRDEPTYTSNAFRYLNVNSTELRVAGETCYLAGIVRWIDAIKERIPVQAQMVYRYYGELHPDSI